MFLFVAIVGYVLLAITFILDKYILSSAKQSALVYTFYSTVSLVIVAAALPFGVTALPSLALWLWAALSGVAFSFALWAVFLGLERGESTHIQPFVGVWIVIATVILSQLLLAEVLPALQWGGVIVLTVASLMLSFERTRGKKLGFHIGYLWAMLGGLLFGLSHVAAKVVYNQVDFLSGFVWSRLFIVPLGLVLMLSPRLWREIRQKPRATKAHPAFSGRALATLITASKVLAAVSVVLLQFAISLGSTTIVNALAGLQYVILFLMVYTLTKFAPKVFKEYFTRREITIQLIALGLVLVGLALFAV